MKMRGDVHCPFDEPLPRLHQLEISISGNPYICFVRAWPLMMS